MTKKLLFLTFGKETLAVLTPLFPPRWNLRGCEAVTYNSSYHFPSFKAKPEKTSFGPSACCEGRGDQTWEEWCVRYFSLHLGKPEVCLQGKSHKWDELGDWDWHMCTALSKTDSWWELSSVLCDDLEGWEGGRRMEGRSKGKGTYVYLWLVLKILSRIFSSLSSLLKSLKKTLETP